MEEHSFSYRAKNEIIQRINSRDKADACLMGVLLCANSLNDGEITVLTENKLLRDFFVLNVNRILECDDGVEVNEIQRKHSAVLYDLCIPRAQDRLFILDYFQLDESRGMSRDDLPKAKYYPYVVGGIFLACGSVNNPEKKYHMEFVMPSLELCNSLGLLLIDNYGIVPKHVERKHYQIVYIKDSENIIDILTMMGAQMASLEIMNVKMMKDVKNKINRSMNCDNANIDKALGAAERQINDIELIDSTMGLDSLPDTLRDIARIRYDNIDFTLKELGAAMEPPISRSGANHRMQKIAEIAENIRKEKAKR
ncbi:DNA-binding protein WhiA [Ruminococcus sp. FC2018]|uniref:DNA-binding protein WhiA n=1 Tax=Ruminococcus sp. FC2018 TaxID=1410617 RepID=UPI000491E0CC|nr:DNA-binding protein WhiA [Ruminococcus sp. FC2018]